MVDEMIPSWEKESIPDDAVLYLRVHKNQLDPNGEPIPGAFRNRPQSTDGMSTDWEKYATPEECRNRARTPADNAVIEFKAGNVRGIPYQIVEHTPINAPTETPPNVNRAHADVFGAKDTQVRLQYMQIYKIRIRSEEAI